LKSLGTTGLYNLMVSAFLGVFSIMTYSDQKC